jgi:hypothetical protein
MAQFGSKRDMGLFISLNKEMIHKYIDTEVLVYKLNLSATSTNVYDESNSKVYEAPILVPGVITIDDQVWNSEDYGADINQAATFAFLRDDLIALNILPQIGDIFEYGSRFFEIDGVVENQYVAGKHADSWFGDQTINGPYGLDLSIIFQAHMTRQSKVNIVQTRFGDSVTINDYILPNNV